jgi:hypothetical protein
MDAQAEIFAGIHRSRKSKPWNPRFCGVNVIGWQGAWKCQRSSVEILCETDPEKAEEKDLPKKDKKERRKAGCSI